MPLREIDIRSHYRLAAPSFVRLLVTIAVILGLCSPCLSNDQQSMERLQANFPKGMQALVAGKYSDCRDYFYSIIRLDPPVHSHFVSFAYYIVAASHALERNVDSSIIALQKAADFGFAEWSDLENNVDFTPVRPDPRFTSVLVRLRENARKKKVYEVVTWSNAYIGFAPQHQFDAYDSEKMRLFRKTYKLDTLIRPSMSAHERHLAAMNWVHHLWPHNNANVSAAFDALTILSAVQKGSTFRCIEFSVVLTQALQALGIPARVVELHKQGVSYGVAKAHAAVEAWNDDLQKWVVLDPQNNAVWRNNDSLLNAYELRSLMLSQQLHGVRIDPQPSRQANFRRPTVNEWIPYFHYLYFRFKNKYFDPDRETVHELAPICLLNEDQKPELLYQGTGRRTDFTTNYKRLYPVLNRAHFEVETNLESPMASRAVKLRLSNSMPWFSHYEVSFGDGKKQVLKKDLLTWNMREGLNTVRITPINKANVAGRESIFELMFYEPRD